MILIQKQPGSLKKHGVVWENNVLAFTPALFQEIQFHFIQLYKSWIHAVRSHLTHQGQANAASVCECMYGSVWEIIQ